MLSMAYGNANGFAPRPSGSPPAKPPGPAAKSPGVVKTSANDLTPPSGVPAAVAPVPPPPVSSLNPG